MPTTPLLPLLGDHNLGHPEAGTWEPKDAAALNAVSKGLIVRKPDAEHSEVDSIPSMWSRPLLFQMALYDSNHPMHTPILGEWRGLLTLLALQERRAFPVTIEPIEIPAANDTNAHRFLRALRRLLPKDTLATETTWDKLHLILFGKNPIGLTSPTTLVCTSRAYVDYISDVSWYNGRCLVDPTSVDQEDPVTHLNPEEKVAVAGWLKKIREKIDNTSDLNEDLSKLLRPLIQNFITDLGSEPQEDSDLSERSLGLTQGIFSYMDKPIKGKEYFTEKLFMIKEKNAFSGAYQPHIRLSGSEDKNPFVNPNKEVNPNEESGTPILPIKENLLRDLDINSLNDRITFEYIEGGIKVNLRLDDGVETSQEYKYVENQSRDHLYKHQEIVEIPTVPVLEIWPNFKIEGWKAYYTYFSKVSQNTFYATPFLPTAGENDDSPPSQEAAGDDENQITQTTYFPEAMLCRYKAPSSSDYEDAGVLLIPSPKRLSSDGNTWTIGIDFGTTSTTVYRNDQNEYTEPHPIEFGERLIQVTKSDGSVRSSLYENFFSPVSEQTPFFTLFHRSRNYQTADVGRLRPLFDGHIYFLRDHKRFNDENTRGKIHYNLKWSTETNDQNYTRVFLEQLCLQCAAEAINEGVTGIEWRYSFPMAFSDRDKQRFQEAWEEVTTNCSDNITGIKKLKEGRESKDVASEAESIVIAKYFANPKFPGTFASGAVCIDIGGATSDISIWQNHQLCSQTSLRFAGRDIFLNLLTENPNFLKHFGVQQDVIDRLSTGRLSETERYAQIDALLEGSLDENDKKLLGDNAARGLKSRYEVWLKLLPSNEFQFPQLIAIGIAGLLYYVGLLLKYLIENGDFKSDAISVYIGGKGSRILKWFGDNRLDRRLLQQVFCDASGITSFRLEITQHPKEEAAFGLVSGTTELEPEEDNDKSLILAGESFTIQAENFKWTEILNSESLGKDLKPTDDLEQIQNFVKSFNKHAGSDGNKVLPIPIEMTESDYTDNGALCRDIRDNLRHIQGEDPQKRRIEPLFILALKSLVKAKTEKWKKETEKQ